MNTNLIWFILYAFAIIGPPLTMTACGPGTPEDFRRSVEHCDELDDDKAATFILACAKNANPMSDEEGEDLVEQCERTAMKVSCIRPGMSYRKSGQGHRTYHCRDAIDNDRTLCIRHGYKYSN